MQREDGCVWGGQDRLIQTLEVKQGRLTAVWKHDSASLTQTAIIAHGSTSQAGTHMDTPPLLIPFTSLSHQPPLIPTVPLSVSLPSFYYWLIYHESQTPWQYIRVGELQLRLWGEISQRKDSSDTRLYFPRSSLLRVYTWLAPRAMGGRLHYKIREPIAGSVAVDVCCHSDTGSGLPGAVCHYRCSVV